MSEKMVIFWSLNEQSPLRAVRRVSTETFAKGGDC